MASERYSFSLTTFSPSGKLVQIEYALQAVASGAPSVGIKVGSFTPSLFLSLTKQTCVGRQWSGSGHREEEQVHPVRGSLHLQDRAGHSEHRDGLQRHGARLQAAGQTGQEDGPGLLPDVPRAHPHRPAGVQSGACDAGVHSVWRSQTVWSLSPDLRLGRARQAGPLPVRPQRGILCLEGHSHGQESGQWENFPGEKVSGQSP